MMSRVIVSLACTSLVFAAAACGSEGDQSTYDPNASRGDESATRPTDPLAGGQNAASNGSTDPSASCAEASAEAKLTPVNLVIAYDRSGSMGDTQEDPSF